MTDNTSAISTESQFLSLSLISFRFQSEQTESWETEVKTLLQSGSKKWWNDQRDPRHRIRNIFGITSMIHSQGNPNRLSLTHLVSRLVI